MNEFFERQPMKGFVIERLQEYMVVARFKIIEVTQLLRSDHILKDEVVDPETDKISVTAVTQPVIVQKTNYFAKKLQKNQLDQDS